LVTEKDEVTLSKWEWKILNKAYGPVTGKRVWGIRTNQELRESYKTPDVVAVIERRRLEWLRHVIRVDETRGAKNIFESKTEFAFSYNVLDLLLNI
jgi:hypothetical protein